MCGTNCRNEQKQNCGPQTSRHSSICRHIWEQPRKNWTIRAFRCYFDRSDSDVFTGRIAWTHCSRFLHFSTSVFLHYLTLERKRKRKGSGWLWTCHDTHLCSSTRAAAANETYVQSECGRGRSASSYVTRCYALQTLAEAALNLLLSASLIRSRKTQQK